MGPTYWLLVVAAVPVVEVLYFSVVVTAGRALGYEYPPRYGFVVHLAYFAAAVGVVLAVTPLSPSLTFEWPMLLAVPLGVGLYHAHNYVWWRLLDAPRTPKSRPAVWTLPTIPGAALEEVLYRGALVPLIDAWGPAAYVGASAVLFGASHLVHRRREALMKTIDGAVYAALLVATGSLLAPVLAHVSFNVAYARLATERT